MAVGEEICYEETKEEGRKLRKLYPCTSSFYGCYPFWNSCLLLLTVGVQCVVDCACISLYIYNGIPRA